jgi:predicted lipoprotein with Yx(FWY)xxD motif
VRKLLVGGVALAAAAALVAGCGGNNKKESKSSSKSQAKTSASTAPATTAPATTAPANATVKVASTTIGQVLVDEQGKTLYLFANDQGTTSAVPPNILQAWPPLMATGKPTGGAGVDASKLGTAPQPNGQTWVTFNGHLLYRFSGDGAAGETKGHKLGNIWFAVTPAGDRAP